MKNLTVADFQAILDTVNTKLNQFEKTEYADFEATGTTHFLNKDVNQYNLSYLNPFFDNCIGFVPNMKLSPTSVKSIVELFTEVKMTEKAILMKCEFGTPLFPVDKMVEMFHNTGVAFNAFVKDDGVVTLIDYLVLNKETGEMTGYTLTADSFPMLGIEL